MKNESATQRQGGDADAPTPAAHRAWTRGRRGGSRARAVDATTFLASAFLLTLTTACSPEASGPTRGYDAPLRSDLELTNDLRALCRSATEVPPGDRRSDAAHPVLVEFSAAWCSDCQRLDEMKQRVRWPGSSPSGPMRRRAEPYQS